MPEELTKSPEEIASEKAAADAAAAEAKRKADQTDLAAAISNGVVNGLAARAAIDNKKTEAQDPPIEEIDPAEIDRRIKNGEPIADLIAKFGAGVEERVRRSVRAETAGAVNGVQETLINQARRELEHFAEYETEILEIVGRVTPAKRTFKMYADATAMVLGRPEVRKKLTDARVAEELAKATAPKKESAGTASTGGAGRMIHSAGADAKGDKLAANEENLRLLCGDDAYNSFIEMKRNRGWTLDGFANMQGYPSAQAWFDRMQENDARTASPDGTGGDLNYVRQPDGTWKEDRPWVTGISR